MAECKTCEDSGWTIKTVKTAAGFVVSFSVPCPYCEVGKGQKKR